MAWTKRDFVTAAFEEIGLASYVYDLQPEQMNMALRRLDSMLATWNAKGIRLGYPIPSDANGSDLDDDSNLPDAANQAVILNLAVQLAPGFGKVVLPETKRGAKDAYNGLLSLMTKPLQQAFPGTFPRGAGTKSWQTTSDPFFPKPETPILSGDDGDIEFT